MNLHLKLVAILLLIAGGGYLYVKLFDLFRY